MVKNTVREVVNVLALHTKYLPSDDTILNADLSSVLEEPRPTPPKVILSMQKTPQIRNFGKFEQVFKKMLSLKTLSKWEKIIYLTLITSNNKSERKQNQKAYKWKHNRDSKWHVQNNSCNVLCEGRWRGSGVDWSSGIVFFHACQTKASLLRLAIIYSPVKIVNLTRRTPN